MTTPQTLEQAKRAPDPETRIRAYTAYILAVEADLKTARRARDRDIAALAAKVGPAAAARRIGLSLSTVKAARGRP